jgi:hypothetical protein
MSDEKKLKLAPVVILQTVTTHNIPTERVLKGALEAGLASVVVIGHDENGEFYFSSSVADGGSVIWDLEMAKKKLLEVSL